MWNLLAKIFKPDPLRFKTRANCTVDESGFYEIKSDGVETSIAWSEVENVDIITTSDGPFAEDLFHVIRGNNACIAIGQFKATELNLLDKYQRLPGFKWEAVLMSAGSVTENVFACWDRTWARAAESAKT